MRILGSISGLLSEAPPGLVFEISEAGISLARTGKTTELDFHPLKPGVIAVSPLRDNIIQPDELALAVRSLAPQNGNRKRRNAALILPDNCARISVLDFDGFPSDPKEQASLVRFRIRKSVPFDVESAVLSYWPQPAGHKKYDVVAVLAPLEVISRYEAPFRAAGLNPGLVTTSTIAALNLVEDNDLIVIAKVTGKVLSVIVVESGKLRLVRSLELAEDTLGEIAADLYPTFIYVEDNLERKAQKLLLCGLGERTEEARQLFQRELGIEVDLLRSPLGLPGENNAGLLGYLHSLRRDVPSTPLKEIENN